MYTASEKKLLFVRGVASTCQPNTWNGARGRAATAVLFSAHKGTRTDNNKCG